jgi:hypothetical protein
MRDGRYFAVFGFTLALGLVVSTYMVTDALRDIRMSHQIIKVRGYAEIRVDSDFAIWNITVKARDKNMAEGYSTLESHHETVLGFLKNNGVKAEEINLSSVQVRERKKRDEKGHETSEIDSFELSQGIEVNSRDVANISTILTTIANLLKAGVEVHPASPRYYYSGVNNLKSQLLVEATKDARERARTLAEGSGVQLGALKAARQGVFSVRSANSTNISSEQSRDDVSSIAKKVTAVVTVDYAMK